MQKSQMFKLGARLLGFYFTVVGLASLPGAVGSWKAAAGSSVPHPWIYVIAALARALVFLICGVVLMLRYRLADIAGTERIVESGPGVLFIGLQLMGVYFVALGLSGLAGAFGETAGAVASWRFRLAQWAPPAVWLVLGSTLALRTAWFASKLQHHEIPRPTSRSSGSR